MAAVDRHLTHADRVVEVLRGITWPDGIKADEIQRREETLTSMAPTRGIFVIVLEEQYGNGVAQKTDVRYRVMVVRSMPTDTHQRNGLDYRSRFRNLLRAALHEQRIMTDGSCEIITKTKPGTMRLPDEWRKRNLDISMMEVTTLIRELS